MRSKLYPLYFLAFFAMNAPSFAGITFNQNQAEIALAPTCSHVPISLPYIAAEASFDESLITVSSDSDWAIPSVNSALDGIDITFATEDLIASYTATISVDDGEKITELFIHANTSPLDIYRLLDDPLRSKTYGIQRDGIYNGSVIAFDPVQDSPMSCLTVGESPTDFVINDDSSELFVINSVGETIDVIDLETFSIKETINLPVYGAWGDVDDTTANIELGPDDIIYYADGSWGPVLHVLKRSTGEILQSIIFDGSSPSNNTGFMDFAVTSDKTKMVAMPQYGWSAGSHSPRIGQYTINGDGTVNFVKTTTLSSFSREPFEAPVLMRDDDQIAVMKTISTDPENTDNLDRVFPSAIWSMNPNGSVVATGDKLYAYDTGIELYTIPGGSVASPGYNSRHTYKAQAFTSDFTRFVYFNSSDRTLNVVNLIDEIGLEQLGRSLSPEDGAVVNSPGTLTWAPLSGVDQYDLYLGTDSASIAAADHASSFYLGRVTGTNFALLQTLTNGTDYFWRVDPVTAHGPETSAVYMFTVSDIALDVTEIDVQTIAGHSDYQVDIQLASLDLGVSWAASTTDSWVTFTDSSGSTPSTLSVHLNASMLSTGFHNSSITVTSDAGQLEIPVKFEVDPLNVTHIRSDRNSSTVYAISEDTSSVISQAYLLEIDSAAEVIQRVTPVGSSVTDFTIHHADNLIYVTNWKSGNLLTIDKSTFEHTKSIAFQPAGATGYSAGDAYRVAAGVSGRVVVEEQDQWVDISLFNTSTETTLNQAFVREGGGAFGPAGRYYYHGENNSSGASIIKFDTSGDAFTQLAEVRPPEISSYYGSRTVVVSEDGSRIFWAGVALDQNLNTEWAVGETVYSTSADGRYAFSEMAIYDVNLRRQVLAMPVSTRVSGYNSTSEKLIIQAGEALGFYSLSTSSAIPPPVLNFSNPTTSSIELSWTDESLEMEFIVQQRLLGSGTWVDVQTTAANVTSWTAFPLQEGSSYEFRVRANSSDYSSPWSNIVIKREDDVIDALGRMLDPVHGAIVTSPDTLTWTSIPWIAQYDIYLGTDAGSIAAADHESPSYLGRVTGTSFDLSQTLINGTDYFWRIDPVTDLGPEIGRVYTFTVSDIGLDLNEIEAKTFAGRSDYQVDIQLISKEAGVAWTASASDPWVTFTESTGFTPSTLSVILDSTTLSVGLHSSIITLTSESNEVQIPVQLQVDPINITHIRSDRNSSIVYAISEDTSSENSQAYLLEIDSESEEIQRVIPVGSSVTDFAIHYADNLIYVTNWKSGNLLVIDKSTFEHTNSITFQPWPAGYRGGDVYQIAAGVSGRVVVEEEDQWIDISIFDSNTEIALSQAYVREGGGAFGPAGRYYYHGENNISNASITKFDTSGDTFTQLTKVRPPEISSYFGSRTVVVSEDGSRVFWAGVALDQNLNTEWGVGEIVYSTSTDGRYAFSETAIYDVDLKRQVLAMPASTRVSGYNSTSEKLIAPVGGILRFYSLTTPVSIPAPLLSANNPTYNSIDLSWTDKSLEMQFIVQQRLLGTNTWNDIRTTVANVTSWIATNLQEGLTYEFRIRASSPDYSSPWSNIASATVLQSIKPVVENANFSSHFTERLQGTLTATAPQGASLNFGIHQQPLYGSVIVNAETGGFTYVPSGTYTGNIDFQFYASNGSVVSNPATVTIELTNTAPVGDIFTESMHWNSIFIGNLAGSDADGDTIHFEIVTRPSTGVFTLIDGTSGEYRYYNTSPDIGSVSFQYRVSDGASSSPIYTVLINLTNSRPVAPATSLETFYTVDISTFIEGLDSDSDILTYEMISASALGSVSLTSSGLLVYSPEGDQGYQAVIPYRVHDGKEWSEPGEITIRVLSVDDVLNDLVTSSVYITEFSANHYAGMVPFAVDFSLTAVGGSSSYLYEWSFGDGESSIEQSPSHVFNGAGEYSVTVTITDLNDAENLATGNLTILVLSPPDEIEVDIDAGNITVDNSQFHVDLVATITGGTAPYTVRIDFGDGNSTELVSSDSTIELTHIYDSLGTYNVSAVVKSSNGVGANILGLGAQQVVVAVEQASGNADSSEGGGAIGWFLWMALFGFLWARKASRHH